MSVANEKPSNVTDETRVMSTLESEMLHKVFCFFKKSTSNFLFPSFEIRKGIYPPPPKKKEIGNPLLIKNDASCDKNGKWFFHRILIESNSS